MPDAQEQYERLKQELELRLDIRQAVKELWPPYERGKSLVVEYQRWLQVGLAAVSRELSDD